MVVANNSCGFHASTVIYPSIDWSTVLHLSNILIQLKKYTVQTLSSWKLRLSTMKWLASTQSMGTCMHVWSEMVVHHKSVVPVTRLLGEGKGEPGISCIRMHLIFPDFGKIHCLYTWPSTLAAFRNVVRNTQKMLISEGFSSYKWAILCCKGILALFCVFHSSLKNHLSFCKTAHANVR